MNFRFFALPILGALALIACSSTTTTTSAPATEPTDGGSDSSTKKDSGKTDDKGGEDETDSGTTDPGPTDCKKTTSAQACGECCAQASPEGAKVYQDAIVDCVCGATVCGTECAATFCKNPPANPDEACVSCFNSKAQTSCGEAVSTACSASPQCGKFAQCMQTSGCQTKG